MCETAEAQYQSALDHKEDLLISVDDEVTFFGTSLRKENLSVISSCNSLLISNICTIVHWKFSTGKTLWCPLPLKP